MTSNIASSTDPKFDPQQRPKPQLRERARAIGIQSLSDAQLVAILLERGSTAESLEDRAHRVLENAGGLLGLSRLGFGALAEEHGVALAAAAKLHAAFELGLRCARLASRPPTHAATSALEVFSWAEARIACLEHEELWILLLDGKNRVLAERLICRGGVHGASTTLADVLRPALREAISGFVLVHNHPSGDPTPSEDDLTFTWRVVRAAALVSLTLVDHVVVARGAYVSMLERGLLDSPTT